MFEQESGEGGYVSCIIIIIRQSHLHGITANARTVEDIGTPEVIDEIALQRNRIQTDELFFKQGNALLLMRTVMFAFPRPVGPKIKSLMSHCRRDALR